MTKQQWRSALLDARRHRSAAAVANARQAITTALVAALGTGDGRPTVCAYLPLPSEPLAPELPALLAARGARVLVPVAHPGEPLDWCELGGPTRAGMLGVAEPTGPRLGSAAIGAADVVLVPALAVDLWGVRLGRGGGHYDRSLALLPRSGAAAGPRLVAVVFDDEVVENLPHEPHDVTVHEVVSPAGGLRHVARHRLGGASSN